MRPVKYSNSINMCCECGYITSLLPFISFSVTVFVLDIEGIQNKVICFRLGTTCSVNVTSTCNANLYDISHRSPSRRAPNLK